ncbi:MAG: AsmA-like C-terminal region-containing protein [Bacteroidota bacterium]
MVTYVFLNKKDIIKKVTTEMSSKLNGNVSIGAIDISFFNHFPKIGVKLNDVVITDSLFPQHQHAFLQVKQAFITLSITKLIQKKSPINGLTLQNGSIYLYTDTSGYTNTYLMQSKKNPGTSVSNSENNIELKTISLKNFHIILDDRKREKLHDFQVQNLKVKLKEKSKKILFDINTSIDIKSLAFNLPRGTYLDNKTFQGNFDIWLDKKTNQLGFDSINIKLQGQPFNLSGKFDLKGSEPQFLLNIHVRKAEYSLVKSLLTKKIAKSLSMVEIDKPLDADAILSGPLNGGQPLVDIKWNISRSRLITPFMDFDDATFTGSYNNEVIKDSPRYDNNSVININNFSANWQSLPVTSNHIEILNLETPILTCDLHSSFPLRSLNEVIQTNTLQLTSGDADMTLTYKGPIEGNNNINSFINGNFVFKNGTILYTPRNVEMKEVNGSMIFSNSNVEIQNLQCNVLNNKIVMNGTAKNLLSLINTEPNKIVLDWNIYSPQLNLASFIFLFKSPKKFGIPTVSTKKKFAKLSSQIDAIIEQSKIDVNITTDKVLYKKFEATGLQANMNILQDRYLLNNVSMNIAGGKMNMSGQLLNDQVNNHTATLNVDLTKVNVKKVFYAFDNFGQDGIVADNLEGVLTSKTNISINLNDDGKILPSSAVGKIDFSLKNGVLNNYAPIKRIQNFIFKKRDFDTIRFAELKDKLEVNRGEIKINRMEIQSSVLTIFVEGIYKPKGKTDISIQVPLSNLKKRGDEYKPENIGSNKKGGGSIFLRGQTGDDGNVKFKLDLFYKFKKDKKKEDIMDKQ